MWGAPCEGKGDGDGAEGARVLEAEAEVREHTDAVGAAGAVEGLDRAGGGLFQRALSV